MNQSQIKDALSQGAELLVTDSNRKRAQRWGTVRENYGYTETANEKPLTKDVTDARLPVFPNETTASQTVAEDRGVDGRGERLRQPRVVRPREPAERGWTATRRRPGRSALSVTFAASGSRFSSTVRSRATTSP